MNPAQRPKTGKLFYRGALYLRMGLSILALATVLLQSGSARRERRPVDSLQAVSQTLPLGAPISGTLSGGTSISYDLPLQSGQLARFRIRQTGNGLELTLMDPSLQTLRELRCAEGAWQVLSAIAEASGRYQLRLRCSLAPGYATAYSVHWIEQRTALPEDKNRVRAEVILAEADQLQLAGREKESRRAIEKYSDAMKYFATLGASGEEAVARLRMGELLLWLGDMTNAEACYSRVLAISDTVQDSLLRVRALNGMAAVRLGTIKIDAALEYCNRALTIARNAGDRWGEAQALQMLGDCEGWSGGYEQSSISYEQALSVMRELSDFRGQAQAMLTLGYNAADLEDLDTAFECHEKAQTLFQAVRDRRGLARVASAKTQLYLKTGRYWEAMDLYGAFRDSFESLDEIMISAQLHNNMGSIYHRMGRYAQALEHYQQALSSYQAARHIGEGNAHNLIGTTLMALGNPKAAAEHHRRAIDFSEKMGDPHLMALSLCYLGDAFAADGQLAAARDLYDKALKIYFRNPNPRGEANAYSALGYVHERRREFQVSLQNYRKALDLYRRIQDRYREFQELYGIAKVELDLGNWQEARVQIEAAVNAVESLRTSIPGPDMRSFFFATTQQCHALYVDILMQGRGEIESKDLSARALHASERARARSLLELLAEAGGSLRQGVNPELLKREQDLQRSINSKANQRTKLLSAKSSPAEVQGLNRKIQELDHAYDDLLAEIAIRSPRYASLKQPQPLTLEQIQEQILDDDTLLLEYALGEKRSYLWLVGKQSLRDYELPARAVIENMAARARGHLIARHTTIAGESAKMQNARFQKSDDAYWLEAARLSQTLLGPAAAELGAKRLVIVPDGYLQYLNFGALPSPRLKGGPKVNGDTGSIRPLIVDHEIVTLPSASTLHVLREQAAKRKPATKSVAVFAAPMFDTPSAQKTNLAEPRRSPAAGQVPQADLQEGFELVPLPATRLEADAIMAMVPAGAGMRAVGDAATRELAMNPALQDYRMIHFATHGFADDANPRMSYIALSTVDAEGKPRNGFLRLLDIYNLNLSADVVVLSACSTAMGKSIQGEGLIGMVRGFMYAGAARVVASLWRVDDRSTAELMKRFYRGMLKDGLAPAAALRAAQVEMFQHERWFAPYHWAAFALQGEYR